jgi:glucans biosynthesis protein C
MSVGPGAERLHALDAVRGGMLILGVCFHAALSFLPGQQLWIVADTSRSLELSGLFFVLHIFRMTVFFLIAGFFGRMLLERRGVGGFIKNRLVRIGVPLVSAWPIVFASIVAVLIWMAIRASGGAPLTGEPPPSPFTVQAFPLTHLWFLYVLLFFYAGALVLHGLVSAIDRHGAFRTRVLDPVVRAIAGPFAPMLLAIPLTAALYFSPHWLMWFGVPTPDTGIVPNTTALIAYGMAFGFGWLVHRQIGILQDWAKHGAANLGLGIFGAWLCLAMAGVAPTLTPAAPSFDTFLYAVCYALSTWGFTLGFIGIAVRLLSGHSPFRRYIADASYWIYIVHLPIVLVLQAVVAPLAWPWFAKYPLILAVAFAIMLASYQLFVRYSFIGAILNGKKQRPAKAKAMPQLAQAE